MARELGMNPERLGGLDNHRQERWKLPLPLFIEELYRTRLGRARPEFVLSIEEHARQQEAKRAEKREAKLRRRAAAAAEAGATVGKVAEPGRCLPLEIYGEDRLREFEESDRLTAGETAGLKDPPRRASTRAGG